MGSPDSSGDVERKAAGRGQVPDSHVFVHLADAYLKEGLLDEAIQICRAGLAVHPDQAPGRTMLARALLERGSLDEAEQEFCRVLEQAPECGPALKSLGEIFARKGQVEAARRHYVQALRLDPDDTDTQDRLAALPVSQDAGAVKPLAQARGRNRDPLASPTLAALYASQGHGDVAEGIYTQIGRRAVATPASSSGDMSGPGAPASLLLEKLLALREAARKIREGGARRRAGREP